MIFAITLIKEVIEFDRLYYFCNNVKMRFESFSICKLAFTWIMNFEFVWIFCVFVEAVINATLKFVELTSTDLIFTRRLKFQFMMTFIYCMLEISVEGEINQYH